MQNVSITYQPQLAWFKSDEFEDTYYLLPITRAASVFPLATVSHKSGIWTVNDIVIPDTPGFPFDVLKQASEILGIV